MKHQGGKRLRKKEQKRQEGQEILGQWDKRDKKDKTNIDKEFFNSTSLIIHCYQS